MQTYTWSIEMLPDLQIGRLIDSICIICGAGYEQAYNPTPQSSRICMKANLFGVDEHKLERSIDIEMECL